MTWSICCQGVSKVLSQFYFFQDLAHFFFYLYRCQFKDISSLTQLKVTRYLYWYSNYMPLPILFTKGLSISVNVLALAADSLIAVILCILLNFSSSGFKKWVFSSLPPPYYMTFQSQTDEIQIRCHHQQNRMSFHILSSAALHLNIFSDDLYGQYRFTHQASRIFFALFFLKNDNRVKYIH